MNFFLKILKQNVNIMIKEINKLLPKYLITGSVVFNVKSMNNIENIKNFDKIKVINNIKNGLEETKSVIDKFSKDIFLESLNAYYFSKN